MDFGDILDQWDRQTGKPMGKMGKKVPRMEHTRIEEDAADDAGQDGGAAGNEPLRSSPAVEPPKDWRRQYDIPDKDAEIAAAAVSPGKRRRRLLAKKPDATLDLHGFTREDAWNTLDGFFRASRQQGCDKLLIIHGRGNHSEGEAILKRTVREFIERCPFAGESGQGASAEGGSGATWVLLKEGTGTDASWDAPVSLD